jgi:hypothetical protein
MGGIGHIFIVDHLNYIPLPSSIKAQWQEQESSRDRRVNEDLEAQFQVSVFSIYKKYWTIIRLSEMFFYYL